jgi:hypothetical protein
MRNRSPYGKFGVANSYKRKVLIIRYLPIKPAMTKHFFDYKSTKKSGIIQRFVLYKVIFVFLKPLINI